MSSTEIAAPNAPIFAPGVYETVPAEDYHQVEALSGSGAKRILQSPAHYRYWRDYPEPPTPALRLGTVTHLAILEPERFEAGILIREPGIDARTKAGKAALDALEAQAAAESRLLITREQYDSCRRMHDAVRRHRGAERLLLDTSLGTRFEVSMFWMDAGYQVPCKLRADVLRADGGIVDLKTTSDASPDGFGRSIAKYQYHVSAAHYMSGAEHCLDRTPPFYALIAVESDPPHGVACYVLQPDQLRAGARQMEIALSRYQIATARGWWEGYSPLIEAAQMPAWALRI